MGSYGLRRCQGKVQLVCDYVLVMDDYVLVWAKPRLVQTLVPLLISSLT
jgi:hypothetical protein